MVKKSRIFLQDFTPSLRTIIVSIFILSISIFTFIISKYYVSYAADEVTVSVKFEDTSQTVTPILPTNGPECDFSSPHSCTVSCTISADEDSCKVPIPKIWKESLPDYSGNYLEWYNLHSNEEDIYARTEAVEKALPDVFGNLSHLYITRDTWENQNHYIHLSLVNAYTHTITYQAGNGVTGLMYTESSPAQESYSIQCRSDMWITFSDLHDKSCTPPTPAGIYFEESINGTRFHAGDDATAYYVDAATGQVLGRASIQKVEQDTTIIVEYRYSRSIYFEANDATLKNGDKVYNGHNPTFTAATCYTSTPDAPCTITSITVPSIIRDGWEILGYSTNSTAEEPVLDSTGILEQINSSNLYQSGGTIPVNITLTKDLHYSALTRKQLTATFMPNGNPGMETETRSCYLVGPKHECQFFSPYIPTSTATPELIGWYPDERTHIALAHTQDLLYPGQTVNYSQSMPTTFYAHTQAREKKYSGSFTYPDDQTTTVKCTISQTYNGIAQASSCRITTPTRAVTGYKRTTWQAPDGETIIGGNSYDLTGDTDFIFHGTPNTYVIRFNANGGTGTMDDQTINYNETATLNKNTFGHSADKFFLGWNTKANGTGTSYTDQASVKNLATDDNAIVTLYAQWGELNTISYDYTTNGGTSSNALTGYRANDTQADLSYTATKNGYDFVGWNTNKDATVGLASYTVTGDTTLYAIFKKTITVTFHPNGAVLSSPNIYSCNAYNTATSCEISYTSPAIIRTGFAIKGFTDAVHSTTVTLVPNTANTETLSSSKDYYAYTYTDRSIEFVPNGNTISGSTTRTCRIAWETNTCIIEAPDFTPIAKEKIGYTDSATYDGASVPIKVGEQLTLRADSGNKTYYAHSVNSRTVHAIIYRYDNNTTETSTCAIEATYDQIAPTDSCQITIKTVPAKTGYTATWKDNDNSVVPGSTININRSYTFTAEYIPIKYYILFDANGGTGTMNTIAKDYDTTFNLPKNQFSSRSDDYGFSKWCTNQDGTGQCYQDQQSVKNLTATADANIKLYAIWDHYVTISFNATENGGTTEATSIRAVAPYTPDLSKYTATKNGYEFVGWNTNKNATTAQTGQMSDENQTFYAIFRKKLMLNIANNFATVLENEPSCEIFNNTPSCEIALPTPTVDPDYTIHGYSTNKNSHSANIPNRLTLTPTSEYLGKTIYPITSYSLATTITYDETGGKAADCVYYNTNTSCVIENQDPDSYAQEGYHFSNYTFLNVSEQLADNKLQYDKNNRTLSINIDKATLAAKAPLSLSAIYKDNSTLANSNDSDSDSNSNPTTLDNNPVVPVSLMTVTAAAMALGLHHLLKRRR